MALILKAAQYKIPSQSKYKPGSPAMQLAEIVYSKVKSLPEPAQKEVLDFVEYLEQKSRQDDRLWSLHSLAAAMSGLESDNWPAYRAEDLKERWD